MMQVSYAQIPDLVGRDLGWTDWLAIDQLMIDRFADDTHDHQWIHVDTERAAPMGGTIAHGFLTLSMVPKLADELLEVTDAAHMLNCGVNRVRFPTPVRSGTRIRMNQVVKSVEERAGGLQITSAFTIESDRDEKPACVAEAVMLVLP